MVLNSDSGVNLSIKDKVNNYLDNKNIRNSFVRENILKFVEEHTKLYGDVVTSEELIDRLEKNLDKVTFAGKNEIQLGEYKGRIQDKVDQNEILIYADESDLELSEGDMKGWDIYTEETKRNILEKRDKRREEIKNTLFHELVHAAYTIKGDYGYGEQHIFSKTGKNVFGLNYYSHVGGNANWQEPIANYIGNRCDNKSSDQLDTYKYETKTVYMIAEKMDEKKIVKAAWKSDEEFFIKSFKDDIGDNYSLVNKKIGEFRNINRRNTNYSKYIAESEKVLESIKDILEGREVKESEFNYEKRKPREVIEKKDGLEDVLNSNIKESSFRNAIKKIKGIFKPKEQINTKEGENYVR